MACTATMTMTSPTQVVGAPCNYVTTVTNGGATPVDVVSIQVSGVDPGTPGQAPAVINQPCLGPNTPKTINNGASLSFSHTCICLTPQTVGAPAQGDSGTYMYAVITTSDGLTCVTYPLLWEYAQPMAAQQQVQVTPQTGQFAFTSSLNSALYMIFF